MFEEIRQSATVPLVARYSEVVEAAMRRGSEPVGRVTELLDACGNAFVTLATLCIARGGHVVYVDTAVSKGFPGIIQVTVTRFGLGMWQTITILQCPPRQALLSDLTVTT